jgi:hypothetical protein
MMKLVDWDDDGDLDLFVESVYWIWYYENVGSRTEPRFKFHGKVQHARICWSAGTRARSTRSIGMAMAARTSSSPANPDGSTILSGLSSKTICLRRRPGDRNPGF